ncbi:hypothetical protein SAMN04487869_1494 [Marinobacter sp. DSM 26671]|nr:hypothetical protein SAMN04487869_1494 [Marinobacter sp. DSM 26671]
MPSEGDKFFDSAERRLVLIGRSADVRFCRKADIQIYALGKFGSLKSKRASGGGLSLLRHRDRYADGFVPGSQV